MQNAPLLQKEHSAILLAFIKLSCIIKIFVFLPFTHDLLTVRTKSMQAAHLYTCVDRGGGSLDNAFLSNQLIL